MAEGNPSSAGLYCPGNIINSMPNINTRLHKATPCFELNPYTTSFCDRDQACSSNYRRIYKHICSTRARVFTNANGEPDTRNPAVY